MAKNPVRRSQLIAPFGVGAMIVIQGGIGLLTAGLDHWYKREDGTADVVEDEYIIEEWRLQRLLRVDHFRLPPDYREPWRYDSSTPNIGLTVPFLRFPRWHFCPWCGRLDERPLSEKGRPKCPECTKDLYQVPFVSMCEAGHLQDFPWREWVHRQRFPVCDGVLRLKATGSATLSGQRVTCDKCDPKGRTLSLITTAYPDGSTYLSKSLTDDHNDFYCPGHLTWLGEDVRKKCTAHLRGSLRSAANVYFAHVSSSIYLPRGTRSVPDELVNLLSTAPISTTLKTVIDALGGIGDGNLEKAVGGITKQPRYAPRFEIYHKDQIIEAAQIAFGAQNQNDNIKNDDSLMTIEDLRREEYKVLRESIDEELLRIEPTHLQDYDPDIAQYFSRIMLVDKLRETRVLTGFSRVFATSGQTLAERKAMLRRNETPWNNWLPAYGVYGEGIFFEFHEQQLSTWEQQPEIVSRIRELDARYRTVQQSRRLREQEITPRFVLLHTFAHILMNRLTFECGYSSAALRERLYVSSSSPGRMSGVLVYTADGDAEGTMGGLVRMGKQGYIEPVIRRALQDATWCSVDPVCTEIGGSSGQGPDSCNLAACHNCALVPETACEEFNRFLDRVTVVGDTNRPDIGYFSVR
jgi:hypothetical protein